MNWTNDCTLEHSKCSRARKSALPIPTRVWQPRPSGAGKRLPKTPLLIERQEVWVKTENLVKDGTVVRVGSGAWAADLPRDRPRPAPSGGGVDSQQAPQGPYGDTSGPRAEAGAAEMTGDGRVAEWAEQSKEAAPFEGSFVSSDSAKSPGCFSWIARWRRRRRKRRIYMLQDD